MSATMTLSLSTRKGWIRRSPPWNTSTSIHASSSRSSGSPTCRTANAGCVRSAAASVTSSTSCPSAASASAMCHARIDGPGMRAVTGSAVATTIRDRLPGRDTDLPIDVDTGPSFPHIRGRTEPAPPKAAPLQQGTGKAVGERAPLQADRRRAEDLGPDLPPGLRQRRVAREAPRPVGGGDVAPPRFLQAARRPPPDRANDGAWVVPDAQPCQLRPPAPVGVLVVEEEVLSQRSDSFDD